MIANDLATVKELQYNDGSCHEFEIAEVLWRMSPLSLRKMPWSRLYCKAAEVHKMFWKLVFGGQAIGEVIVEEVARAATKFSLCDNKYQRAPS